MRKIKFRGKAIYDGTKHKKGDWLFGDLNHIYSKVYIFDRGNGSVDGTDCYEVDKETVGQFTGLEDKNNKLIFEGDIVKYLEGKTNYVVEFRAGCFLLDCINDDSYSELLGFYNFKRGVANKSSDFEILDSCHDNKKQ